MGTVTMINWVTLDGVMQAPGRPDEDPRDGFTAGGWATRYSDPTVLAAVGERLGGGHAWLLGRRTYEDLLESWNRQGGSFAVALNDAPKHVATHDPQLRLGWPNSAILSGDVPAAVAELRRDRDLVIMGSGVLVATLMAADLIDEYLLLIAPLVLGTGRRLFADGGPPATVILRETRHSATGVIIARYGGSELG